jgi:hypothetical protein
LDKRVFVYLIPIILLISLAYVMIHFFVPPITGMPEGGEFRPGPECSAGEAVACVSASGCRGHRPCQLGSLGECMVDYECTPGEIGNCPFTVCTAGKRTCDECGRWGVCVGPPGCNESGVCAPGNDTN